MSSGDIKRRDLLKLMLLGLTGASCSKEATGPMKFRKSVYRNQKKGSLALKSMKRKINALRPNIVLILADDMGYGDLGCYGNRIIKTPHLDRLAREGIRFTDFYASNALCSPSRAGLLTGRYPHRTGVTFPLQSGKDTLMRKVIRRLGLFLGSLGVVDMQKGKSIVDGLPQSEITLSEMLKVAGYRSAAIGKWHLGDFVTRPEYHPKHHGFDHFLGFNGANDDWPIAFWRNNMELESDIGLDQGPYTRILTEEAVHFIDKNKDSPFFLYFAHKDPHQPCIPSEKFKGSSDAGPHGDAVQELDWSVGEIMKALRKNMLDRNTIVFFMSDNGPWYDGSPGNLRGRKGESFEGGYRVPMIARWPGRIPAGKVSNLPHMNIDIFPTLADLAGVQVPSDRILDGKNLWPVLSGRQITPLHEALFFFHNNELEGIRKGKWKCFRYVNTKVWPIPLDKPETFFGKLAGGHDYHPKGSDESVPTFASWPLLYNMELDPSESYNLIKRFPEVGDELLAEMRKWEEDFERNPRGWK